MEQRNENAEAILERVLSHLNSRYFSESPENLDVLDAIEVVEEKLDDVRYPGRRFAKGGSLALTEATPFRVR